MLAEAGRRWREAWGSRGRYPGMTALDIAQNVLDFIQNVFEEKKR
jgi:hypothetical protein